MGNDAHAVIDCDGHLIESIEELAEYLDTPTREAVLNPSRDREGVFPSLDGFHGPRIPHDIVSSDYVTASDFRKGSGEDYQAFVNAAGLEQAVIFTSEGLSVGFIQQTDYAVRVCQAYNNYVSDRFRKLDARMHPMALIPMQDPDAAATELRRAVSELDLIGAMLPSRGLPLDLGHPYYWPVYREAAELGCALGVHGGSALGSGMDSFRSFNAMYGLHHSIPLLSGLASFVGHGVFEKIPGLKVGFFEGGCAWVVALLDRMDRHDEIFDADAPRALRDYLAAGQVLIGCEGNDGSLPYLAERVGIEGFSWASDYPHEVDLVMAKQMIQDTLDEPLLSEDQKRAVLADNARNFFGLPTTVPAG
jgi:predicted TIM-barrel fold metal-dependent hydrolase